MFKAIESFAEVPLGVSVNALDVEISGSGNSTQGSISSHMQTRDDLNYHRGCTWRVLKGTKERNPILAPDGTA